MGHHPQSPRFGYETLCIKNTLYILHQFTPNTNSQQSGGKLLVEQLCYTQCVRLDLQVLQLRQVPCVTCYKAFVF